MVPTPPVDSDELLKFYAGPDPEEVLEVNHEQREERLLGLRTLEYLRYRKAKLLNKFEIDGIVSGLVAGEGGPVGNTNVVTYYSNIGSRLWAILVGINEYNDPNVKSLDGCVADVKRMVEYLTTIIHVPESHILVLTSPLDEEIKGVAGGLAERANIIDALYTHFRDNAHVQHGDNLLFHFSGHGSSYDPDLAFGTSFTEALCPMDRGKIGGTPAVYDISDRELNIIFGDIRDSKGPNLTVVLDCCHSGGATRSICGGPQCAGGRAVEGLRVPGAVRGMFKIAATLRRPEGSPSPLSSSWSNDMTSHVLLAACRPHELARECGVPEGGRLGAFTFALISVLSSPQGVDPALTYAELVRKVIQPPPMQSIVLAGARKNARLWFQEGPLPAQEVAIRGSHQTGVLGAEDETDVETEAGSSKKLWAQTFMGGVWSVLGRLKM